MKNLKKLLLISTVVVLALMCLVFSASAVDAAGQCGENVYWTYDSETESLVISGEGATYDYFDSIYSCTPFYNSNIRSVVIEEGITSIGSYFFSECRKLEEVTIPSTVTKINCDAFWQTVSLKSVYAADLVSWISIEYVDGMYYDLTTPLGSNTQLYIDGELPVEVVIPEGVTKIGTEAFFCCKSLKMVVIPDSVTSIGRNAFAGCKNLEEIVIGKNIKSVGSNAFSNCSTYKTVHIPDVESWVQIEFADAYANPFHISGGVFMLDGKELYNIVIPEGVTRIGAYSFYYCTEMESVTIPKSVTSIGGNAVTGDTLIYCYKDSVAYSRLNGTKMRYVVVDGSDAENLFSGTSGRNVSWSFDKRTGVLKIIAKGATPDYTKALPAPWGVHANYITKIEFADGITSIGQRAFMNLDKLIAIDIPEGVDTVGAYAFYGCNSVRSLELPDTMKTIHGDAFHGCSCVEELELPDGITFIGSSAFRYFHRLKKLVLPEGLKEIHNYSFGDCANLTEIHLPSTLRYIGSLTFSRSNNIKDIYVADAKTWFNMNVEDTNLLDVYENLYFDGELVKNLVVPASVKTVREKAFYSCDSLETVVISEGVTRISGEAFAECKNLKSVEIASTVSALYNSGVTDTTWPESNFSVFRNCANLADVKFNVNNDNLTCVDFIPPYTFDGCTNLKEIEIPASVKKIYSKSLPFSIESVTVYNPDCIFVNSCGITFNSFITGYVGSTAEAFADKLTAHFTDVETVHSHSFKVISDTKPTSTKEGLYLERCKCGKENKIVREKLAVGKTDKITAAQNTSAIKITWTAVPGADGYRVYQKVASGWKTLGNTVNTSATIGNLAVGTKYTFAVKAAKKVDGTVIWAEEYTTVTTATKPADVTAKATSTVKGKINLSWNSVDGIDGYCIYYKSGNGNYKLYKTVSASTSGMSFSNLKSGTKYTFAVRAGIKTAGGNIFGGYKEAIVTVK